jgi:hypothetical protein
LAVQYKGIAIELCSIHRSLLEARVRATTDTPLFMDEDNQKPPLNTRDEYDIAREKVEKNIAPNGHDKERSPHCTVLFGVCRGKFRRSFGKPKTDEEKKNAHICATGKLSLTQKGVVAEYASHKSRLHVCGVCGTIGAVVVPSKGTKADREYLHLMKQQRLNKSMDSGFRADMNQLQEQQ